MTKNRLNVFLVCVLAMTLIVAACSNGDTETGVQEEEEGQEEQEQEEPEENGGADTTEAEGEKAISVGITEAPANFNPIERHDFGVIYVTDVLFNPLMELNDDFEFVPRLADSIETEDNQTHVIHLNQDATWTDGTPVTADDVLFALKMFTHPDVGSLNASQFNILEGTGEDGFVESGNLEDIGANKVDDHTLELVTETPVNENLFHTKISIILKALPEHVLGDVDPEGLYEHPFMQGPEVSYGPFHFVDYQRDQYIELEANEHYYDGEPNIDKLYFRITSPANLAALLESGDIHMNVPEIGSIPVQDFERVQALNGMQSEFGNPVAYTVLGANNVRDTGDSRVKQAFVHAVDRETMVNELLQGEAEIVEGPMSSVHPYHNENVQHIYDYDPERAIELLEEADFDFDQTLDFMVPSGDTLNEQVSAIIEQNLQDIGVQTSIYTQDTATAVQSMMNQEPDIWIWFGQFQIDPDYSRLYKTGASLNLSGFSDEEMDEVMDQGIQTVSDEERREVYEEFQELFAEKLPQIPLFHNKPLRAVSEDVIVGAPKGSGMFINVHEWDIEN